MQQTHIKKGFTIVEMIVVIGIISAMAAVALASYSEYLKRGRDHDREVTVEQMSVVMRLYMEQYGADVDCDYGLKIDGSMTVQSIPATNTCPDGAQILSFLQENMQGVPVDPKGPGSDDYYYYLDTNHICQNAPDGGIIFAANLEQKETNALTECGDQQGNEGGFINTTQFGGSISPSKPYVKIIRGL